MDATRLLAAQHREVEALFARFGEEHDEDARGRLVQEITRHLSVHAAIEEQVFYPAVADHVPGGGELAGHARDDHREVKQLLAELERMRPDEESFAHKVDTLRREVERHVSDEEQRLFPAVEETLDNGRRKALGEEMEAKQRLAPVHPHPHAPDTAPFNRVAGPAAGIIDRARDALRDERG